MKITFIFVLILNVIFLAYGGIEYSKTNQLITKYRETTLPQAPKNEEWTKLSDPAHFAFIKEHVSKFTVNVRELSNSIHLGAKKVRNQSMALMMLSILNMLLFVLSRRKQKN